MEIRFYATLRPLVGGRSVQLDGSPPTVGAVIDRLIADHPALEERLIDESGQVRRFVAVMLNGRDIRHLEGLETAIPPNSDMDIFPPVAGGASPVFGKLGITLPPRIGGSGDLTCLEGS